MPAQKKKKLHQHVKDTVVNWDDRMKKYRFYKEVVKDFLLMIPLVGAAGSTIMNWAYKSFVRYNEAAKAVRSSYESEAPARPRERSGVESSAGSRSTESRELREEVIVDSAPHAASEPMFSMGDMINIFFVFWLVVIVGWRIVVWVKRKFNPKDQT